MSAAPRIYISVDMEGVAGVVHEEQTNPYDARFATEYQRSCRLMTAEANAAIEGALRAGAGRIVVNDSHCVISPWLLGGRRFFPAVMWSG